MKVDFKKYSLALILSLSLNAQETYNVDELIIKALENSPDLKISSYNYDASKERFNTSSSAYLPNLNLHLGLGKAGVSDIPTQPNDMIEDTLILGQLSLKQIVYDFGKTGSNVDTFEYDSEAYGMQNKQKISDKIKDVKQAYYNILQAKAIIDVNLENIQLNEIQLYRSKKYFDAGIRTKIDVSDAKVQLIQANLDLKNSQYNLKLAYAKLDKIIGFKEINTNYNVYKTPLDLSKLDQSLTPYPLTLKEAIEYAYENRYELKKYAVLIKSSQAQENLAASDYYPSVYFDADYTKQKIDKFVSTPEDQWQATLNLDWNLYEGGATSSNTQEKQTQTKISQSEYINTKLSIKDETTQAYIYMYKIKDSVVLSQSLLGVSKEKFDQAAKRYEHGLSDYIELQQSRQGYIDAMASLVVNYYDYFSAIAALDNAIGR